MRCAFTQSAESAAVAWQGAFRIFKVLGRFTFGSAGRNLDLDSRRENERRKTCAARSSGSTRNLWLHTLVVPGLG